jgi:uncharacterized protein YihD (DUF1040 family)
MSLDQPDFELKKQSLIDQFLLNEKSESDEERDKAFEELSIEILKLQFAKTDISEEEFAKVVKSFKEKMAVMECDDPRLAHSIIGLNKIGNSKYGKASRYVEELLKSRKEEFSADQRKRAQSPRSNQFTELIKSYLRFTPDMTLKDLLSRLQSEIGKGVITEVTDEDIFYYPNNGNQAIAIPTPISGLKNRLSRLKTTARKNV